MALDCMSAVLNLIGHGSIPVIHCLLWRAQRTAVFIGDIMYKNEEYNINCHLTKLKKNRKWVALLYFMEQYRTEAMYYAYVQLRGRNNDLWSLIHTQMRPGHTILLLSLLVSFVSDASSKGRMLNQFIFCAENFVYECADLGCFFFTRATLC